jgi:DNA ligase (NAD+)
VLDAPALPDAEYDRMFQRAAGDRGRVPRAAYARLADPARGRQGARRNFVPVRHAVPMLSIRTETDTDATAVVAASTRACGASSS